jgi:peptidoglycan hydrolase-like protein with peptidoglycan-binding domain
MAATANKKLPTKSAKKSTKTKKTIKLPGFFRSKRFVVLLVFVVAFAALGSYRLYSSQAARAYPTVNQCLAFKNSLVLSQGTNQTACTKTLQGFLNRYRVETGNTRNTNWPRLGVDGAFGGKTKQAVVAFQFTAKGLGTRITRVDGIVGKQTWNAIELACSNSRGNPRNSMSTYCRQGPPAGGPVY